MTAKLRLPIKLALAFFALVATAGSAGEPLPVPDKFSAHIGGVLGASYGVELKDGILSYTKSSRGGSAREQKTITATAAQWREFRQSLDEIKVWQWHSDYPTHGVMDGTQWALDIDYSDHTLHARGSNNYPDDTGKPNGSPEQTKAFRRYLAAVQRLIGADKFE